MWLRDTAYVFTLSTVIVRFLLRGQPGVNPYRDCAEVLRKLCNVSALQLPIPARAPYDFRTETVGGCGACTATALTLHDFHTISVQSLYGFTPGCPEAPYRRNRTMPLVNVNTYAVARSHIRCQKIARKIVKKMYRTASGANVN